MTDAPEVVESTDADAPVSAPEPQVIHGAPVLEINGQRIVHPSLAQYVELVKLLHSDGYLMCVDLTAVDYKTHPGRVDLPEGVTPERFELVANLISHRTRDRIRIRVQVSETDPTVPSLFDIHPGTEAMEREIFDLFGIAFEGHPDLTRILMPEDWVGHPLRKDYASGRIPVQFKATGSR